MDDHEILNYCVEKWNEKFCGILSIEAAGELGIEHERVRKVFRQLKKADKGSLVDGVEIPDRSKPQKESGQTGRRKKATIFYPGQTVLKNYFDGSEWAKQDIPEYRKELHHGHRKSDLRYFSPSVLGRYKENPDKYNIEDLPGVGFISSNLSFSAAPSVGNVPAQHFSTKRYGKIHTEEGKLVIVTMLRDLADLPSSEQEHWRAHQIEPQKAYDPKFQKYYLKFFRGVPADSHDPLNDLLNLLRKINSLPHIGRLFKKLDRSNLKYPVQNTFENFRESCTELYKRIGPSGINNRILRRFLRKNFNYSGSDLNVKRYKRRLKLFQEFLEKTGLFDNSINEITEKIKDQKKGSYSSPDYLSEFKQICRSLLLSYRILFEKLKVEEFSKTEEPINKGFK